MAAAGQHSVGGGARTHEGGVCFRREHASWRTSHATRVPPQGSRAQAPRHTGGGAAPSSANQCEAVVGTGGLASHGRLRRRQAQTCTGETTAHAGGARTPPHTDTGAQKHRARHRAHGTYTHPPARARRHTTPHHTTPHLTTPHARVWRGTMLLATMRRKSNPTPLCTSLQPQGR